MFVAGLAATSTTSTCQVLLGALGGQHPPAHLPRHTLAALYSDSVRLGQRLLKQQCCNTVTKAEATIKTKIHRPLLPPTVWGAGPALHTVWVRQGGLSSIEYVLFVQLLRPARTGIFAGQFAALRADMLARAGRRLGAGRWMTSGPARL